MKLEELLKKNTTPPPSNLKTCKEMGLFGQGYHEFDDDDDDENWDEEDEYEEY